MIKKRIIVTGISGLVAIGFLTASPASASTLTRNHAAGANNGKGVIGIVSSVSGSSITLIAKDRQASSTFAVDASNATVVKSGATSSISAIQAGDTLLVRGTVSGTSVVASKIIDGLPQMHEGKAHSSSTGAVKDRPTFGSVTAVSGASFTLQMPAFKNKATTTVTINTDGNTTFKKDNVSSSLAGLASGQKVMVTGTRDASGTVIQATRVNIVTAMPDIRKAKGHGQKKAAK